MTKALHQQLDSSLIEKQVGRRTVEGAILEQALDDGSLAEPDVKVVALVHGQDEDDRVKCERDGPAVRKVLFSSSTTL